MTPIEWIMIAILVVMFIVATKWPMNIGIMGFVAAFFVGWFLLGMDDAGSCSAWTTRRSSRSSPPRSS